MTLNYTTKIVTHPPPGGGDPKARVCEALAGLRKRLRQAVMM
jgi:hypothetical protein